jgi:hypothetical protein
VGFLGGFLGWVFLVVFLMPTLLGIDSWAPTFKNTFSGLLKAYKSGSDSNSLSLFHADEKRIVKLLKMRAR